MASNNIGILWVASMLLFFGSVGILSYMVFPFAFDRWVDINRKRSQALADDMEQAYVRVRVQRLSVLYILGPMLFGVAAFLTFPEELKLIGVIFGFVIGFVGPSIYVKSFIEKRRSKFQTQLIDALMILSSSLKGGLSLIQALEVVVEEMPDPINQEFAILLGENKMGVVLEESFARLYRRMPSIALHQIITAILLARETGGNLPIIFARIVTTIRENKKIQQNIDNLTLQGKLQGVIMSLLPVGFGIVVYSSNNKFFDLMLNSDLGRGLLIYAFISECIGVFMIWRISTFKNF